MLTVLFVPLFLFATVKGSLSLDPTSNYIGQEVKISVNSKDFEKIYNMRFISNEDLYNCAASKEESLNLDEMGLFMIKNNIIRSDAIRHLCIRKNYLDDIPRNIIYITHLTYLNLSKNKINLFISHPIQHLHLQTLDISYQDKISITEKSSFETESEVEDLGETEDVDIFKSFNNTGMYLPSLKVLILDGNNISSISSDFDKSFPILTHLYLRNIYAKMIHPRFFTLIPKSLRALHLENNNLRNLTLENLQDITELYLDRNPLERIYIISKQLRILSLSNCIKLIYGKFDTPYLDYLDLSMNDMHSVSNIKFDMYQSLRTLLLDHNKLSKIPVLMGLPLIELSLSYNLITQITAKSFEYLFLKKLSLRGNVIQHIDKNGFSGLKNLEYLDLSENKLNTLPDDWTLALMNLRYLNMRSNQFITILDLAINSESSLTHLFIKDNILKTIRTSELLTLPKSVTVYVA